MSKCENCICNPVCDHNKYGFENCNSFKDKSFIVELPCKVGDTIYFVYETDNDTMFIDKGKVEGFSIGDKNEGIWFRGIYENLSSYWHTALSINDTVFLTKEQAEEKLKEIDGR